MSALEIRIPMATDFVIRFVYSGSIKLIFFMFCVNSATVVMTSNVQT